MKDLIAAYVDNFVVDIVMKIPGFLGGCLQVNREQSNHRRRRENVVVLVSYHCSFSVDLT